MSEWKESKLEDVVHLKRGFDLATRNRKPGRFPVVGSAGISGWHDEGPILGPALVLGRAGASMGVANYCEVERFWPLNTALFVEDFKGNDPRFIFHLFQVIDFTGFNSGSVQPMLNRNYIRDVKVRIPDLDEQRNVSAILKAIDDKIAVNERVAAVAGDLGEAHSQRAHQEAKLAKLASVTQITMGSSPPGESYNEDGIGLAFYQGTRDFGDRFPGRRVWCTSPVRTADPGSCLLSVRAPVGRINIARELCCIGRGVAAVKSVSGTPSVLYYELMASSEAWLPYESEGTVFGAINKKQLENIEILALDPEAAGDLEGILAPLDQRVASSSDENRKLAELRDTLLPKLISGEIRIREAEKVVEEVT